MAATRGECPDCGGTVFRMGRTNAHGNSARPAPVQVAGKTRSKLTQNTLYIACASANQEFAEQLAADLEKGGLPNWVHGTEDDPNVQWAGGVHPALKECLRMVLVLSDEGLNDDGVNAAWQFFREKRKPILIAQISAIAPPDAIRRSPRFDFSHDYKAAFRQLMVALDQ
jgi:hypothetical protein